ncbi:MAG: hypothetical protein AB1467_01980 [Candidatus Diapherotrites archaeon]
MNLPKSFLVLTVSLILVLTAGSVTAALAPGNNETIEGGGNIITPPIPTGTVSLVLEPNYLAGQEIQVKVYNGSNERIYYTVQGCSKPFKLCKFNYSQGLIAQTAEEQPFPTNVTCTEVSYMVRQLVGCDDISTKLSIEPNTIQTIATWGQTYYSSSLVKAEPVLAEPGTYQATFNYFTEKFSTEPVAYTAEIAPEKPDLHVIKTEYSTKRVFTIISPENPVVPVTPPTPITPNPPTKPLFKLVTARVIPSNYSVTVDALLAMKSGLDLTKISVKASLYNAGLIAQTMKSTQEVAKEGGIVIQLAEEMPALPPDALVAEKALGPPVCTTWGMTSDPIPVEPSGQGMIQTAAATTKSTISVVSPIKIGLPFKNSNIQSCYYPKISFEGLKGYYKMVVTATYSDTANPLEDSKSSVFSVTGKPKIISDIIPDKYILPIGKDQLISGTAYVVNLDKTLATENITVSAKLIDPTGKETAYIVKDVEVAQLTSEAQTPETTENVTASNSLLQIKYQFVIPAATLTTEGKYNVDATLAFDGQTVQKKTFFNVHYPVIAEPNKCAKLREELMKECKKLLPAIVKDSLPAVTPSKPGEAQASKTSAIAPMLGWVAVSKAKLTEAPSTEDGSIEDQVATEGRADTVRQLYVADDMYPTKKQLMMNIKDIKRRIVDCRTGEIVQTFKVSAPSYNGNCGSNKKDECSKGNDYYIDDACEIKETANPIKVNRVTYYCSNDAVASSKEFMAGETTGYWPKCGISTKQEMCSKGTTYIKEDCREIQPDPKTQDFRACVRAGLNKIKEECANPELGPYDRVKLIKIGPKAKITANAIIEDNAVPVDMDIKSTNTVEAQVKTIEKTVEKIKVSSDPINVTIASADGTQATTSLSVQISDGELSAVDGTVTQIDLTPKIAKMKLTEKSEIVSDSIPDEFELTKKGKMVQYKAKVKVKETCLGFIRSETTGTAEVNAQTGSTTSTKDASSWGFFGFLCS